MNKSDKIRAAKIISTSAPPYRSYGERLILNLLDNELSFQPNAFVTRNYHSLGGGSLEKLGGRGGTRNFFIPITFLKIVL